MVTYPPWFSALDRWRVDRALADHQAPVVTHEVPGRVISERKYASEAVAVQAVLAVFRPSSAETNTQLTVSLDPRRYRGASLDFGCLRRTAWGS
jgi:hypothetical protein